MNSSMHHLASIEKYVVCLEYASFVGDGLTIAVDPYIVNYTGVVFCQYSSKYWRGPIMLKQVDGSYACFVDSEAWITLGQAKELLRVIGLREEGSSLEFLRRGYKHMMETSRVTIIKFLCCRMLHGGNRTLIRRLRLPGKLEVLHLLAECFLIWNWE
ncbi:hypothetical protein ZEAMMB73_Zm00001d052460 [Zea mays]|uniref:Uncharacterized protein n=1 Tax=Zea mays TaxID=4577 RepID=A0A1D6QHD8_MAIZE|nr:hypothetical protein ZEAMMB73_Zm00001d052460 [Zea mays]